jgi:hypothetical protein
MKKKYITPTTKVHIVIMPQILAGSEIEQGGEQGGGNHGEVGNSLDADFEE